MALLRLCLLLPGAVLCRALVEPGSLEGYAGNQGSTSGLEQESYATRAAEGVFGPRLTQVRAIARQLRVYPMIGFVENRNGKVYNSAAVFSPQGEIISPYPQSHPRNDEPCNTKRERLPAAKIEFGQWGTLICFDWQLPAAARILATYELSPLSGRLGEPTPRR